MPSQVNSHFTGDNLYIMHGLNSELADLIYLDPPFNSKRMYSAPVGSKAAGASFSDMWTWSDIDAACLEGLYQNHPNLVNHITAAGTTHSTAMKSYLTYMGQRLIEIHRILKTTGTLYLHCDPTASHYLKILLDSIFGRNNFRNEIIWYYKNASRGKKQLAKSHDIILVYSKSEEFIFNRDAILVPFESGMTEWRYSRGGQKDKETPKGKTPDDVITLPSLNTMSKERTGYPTQKPLKLLEFIILASSNEGDVVFDPFAGCATTCVAAQQLGRKWIGIDISKKSAELIAERLKDDAGLFTDFAHRTDNPHRTDIKKEPPSPSVKKRLYKVQKGTCNGCFNDYLIKDMVVDHIIPSSKGGGDYYENYQLLCGNCNSIKGDRPMEYLRQKYKTRDEALAKISFGE